jgi:hypothetical protein
MADAYHFELRRRILLSTQCCRVLFPRRSYLKLCSMPFLLNGKVNGLGKHSQRTDADSLTPISTIIGAYDRFLNDDSLTGQAMECSADKQILLPFPEYANGSVTKRACTVWDPLFKMMHSENSGLADAIA